MAPRHAKPKKKKVPNEKMVREFSALLPCVLTDAEALERGRELAQVDSRIREEEIHAKACKKDLDSRMGHLEVERGRLAYIVRNNKEPRPTQVEGWAVYEAGIYEEVRLDTGEVIPSTRRRLSEDERQENLALGVPLEKTGEPATKTIGKKPPTDDAAAAKVNAKRKTDDPPGMTTFDGTDPEDGPDAAA